MIGLTMLLHQPLKSIALLLLCSVASLHATLQPNALFPFGESFDQRLSPNDDASSPELALDKDLTFYGRPRHSIYVNTNGLLSFEESASIFSSNPFPLTSTQAIIAPFWGDVDTEPMGSGTVYHRQTDDSQTLALADEYVHAGFVQWRSFRSTDLFIATWDHVGYFGRRNDKTNAFQCVLASDNQKNLFVIFLYKDIQWTTGDTVNRMGGGGLGGIPAQAGFNAGDMVNYYALPASRSDSIVDIEQTSNIGVPGAWVFLVSGDSVVGGGCVESGVQVFPTYGNVLGGDLITLQGCVNGAVVCDFDGVQRQATPISQIEAVCVLPPLGRIGMVTMKVLVDGRVMETLVFTSVDIEPSHQVDVTPSTGTLTFTSTDKLRIQWSPQAILPPIPPNQYQIDIVLYELNPSTNTWVYSTTLLSNSRNDGDETVNIVDLPVTASDIAPVAIQVVALQASVANAIYRNLTSDPVGKWSAQFYYVQPNVTGLDTHYLCMDWYRSESTRPPLVQSVVACPPRREQALLQNSGLKELRMSSSFGNTLYHSQWIGFFHPQAQSCFTQRTVDSQSSAPQQECCYDSEGSLLAGPPKGGRVHEGIGHGGRYLEDNRPYILCCQGTLRSCQLLYERRPSDNGGRYNPPRAAWMMGDPHLITLDGHTYTFNGHGEFTLINTTENSFTLQGRMTQLSPAPFDATVFQAIAIREGDSDIVMVTASGSGLGVFLNGVRNNQGVHSEQMFNGGILFSRGENIVGVGFDSGAYMEVSYGNGFLSKIVVSLPSVYVGKTRGLLGVYNGDQSDDLMLSSGQRLELSANDEDLHNQFGLSWMITPSDSLFMYLPYETFASFSDPLFSPTLSVDNSTASIELTTVCQADNYCVYDGLVSNNTDIARSTRESMLEARMLLELSVEVTCSPPCENGVCVSNSTCSCNLGYSGPTCATPLYEACQYNLCLQGQACGVLGGSYYCQSDCDGGNSGSPLCQLQDSGVCADNPCENGGVCAPSDDSSNFNYTCRCRPGYRGLLCGIGPTTSPCAQNPCLNGGTCSFDDDSTSSYKCSCVNGFSGENCSEIGMNITIAIIVSAVAGSVIILIVLIGLILFCCWVACGRYGRKKNKESVGDSNVALTMMRPPSQLLEPRKSQPNSRPNSQMMNGRKGSLNISLSEMPSTTTTTLGSSDPHLHKPHRLTMSREPLIGHEPSTRNVLVTSPIGASSTNSLSVHRVASGPSSGGGRRDSLPMGRSASTLPPNGRSNSNTYINVPNGGRAHSQLEYYESLRLHGQQFFSTQSMNLSQQSPPYGAVQKQTSRRASLNTVGSINGFSNGLRDSVAESDV